MNLYEKLNRLDDSLVESKRVVKKKKLIEGVTKKSLKEDYNSEDAIELVAEMITGGDTGLAEEFCDALNDWGVPVYAEGSSWFAGAREDYAKILAEHSISLPMSDSDIDNAVKIIGIEYYNWTQSEEIKRQVAELEQDSRIESAMDWYNDTRAADDAGWPNAELAGDPEFLDSALNWYLDSYYYDLDHEDDEEDYDDDIDEMLTESEVGARKKLMDTFPDDFGHWEPWNDSPSQSPEPKTLDQYARDPRTKEVNASTSTTATKELGARQKLRNAFPDLNIPYADSDEHENRPLKEAIKDTDYVIAYVHPVSTFSKRYSFLGSNYRMTKDLDKAMTYTSKFSAEDEVKYAKDEVERIVDSSTSTGYASNFAADSDRFLVVTVAQARELLKNPDKKVSRAVSNNAEAYKAAKPVATEIHSIIKKYNVSLNSFLMLIKEFIKAEDPEA